MDIWKGSILGTLNKHRDYEHGNFYDHIRDNGEIIGFRTQDGEDYVLPHEYTQEDIDELEEEVLADMREEAEKLMLYSFKVNPITGIRFKNEQLYAALVLVLSQSEYDYFIPTRRDKLVPTEEEIRAVLDEYIENHVEDRYEQILEHANEVTRS